MNKRTLFPLLALTQTAVFAGESPLVEEPKEEWFKFSVNARARIEQRNIGGSSNPDNSWAGTFRIRPGFHLGKEEGFAGFVETEHTLSFIDDFQVGTPQSANFSPHAANNTPIGDPENNELNQLYVQYKGHGGLVRVGRQRLIYDNAAFIGNVGWRQNEQTLDAAHVKYGNDNFTLKYAYTDRVNRIFGTDAQGAVKALKGDAHLFNGSYTFGEHSLSGYVYLMDFSEQQFSRASNNTYGGFLKFDLGGGTLHSEFAYQTEAGDQDSYDAFYYHVNYGNKVNGFSYKLGVERLGADFVTPLATVHAFNGFADVFTADRLGLTPNASNWDGITDIYASLGSKVAGDVMLKGFIHGMFDDQADQFYGFEFDAVAAKKINQNLKAIAKYAYYLADGGSDFARFNENVAQFSVELNYTF